MLKKMSDTPKALKFSDVKLFWSALSPKERRSVVARGILTFVALFFLLPLARKIGVNESELCVSLLFLTGGALFLPSVLFLLFYWPFFLLLLTDFHLYRSYGLSLFGIGEQVAALIADTNKAEVFEYLARAGCAEWGALLFTAVISCFVPFYAPVWKNIPEKWLRAIILTLCISYPFGYISHLYPAVQSEFASERNGILAKAAAFRFNPEKKRHKADTVVILIGETHRQTEFHPAFDKYASHFQTLYRFSDMISPFSGTLNAVPIILSRKKGRDHFNFFYEKSLFSLFGEAGYSTYFVHYIDNSSELNGLNFIYREADRFIKYAKKVTPETDEGILPILDGILKNPERKKLIVIKMIGVHINFSFRYPDPDFSRLQRILSVMKRKTPEMEMYHYKKAVDYSAGIIAGVMERIEKRPEPSMLLFSSDHGICIFDKGYFHLPATCQNAFHIPAMILLNPALTKATSNEAKNNLACNRDKPLTQEYYFETVATLAGISYPAADSNYDLTRICDPLKGKKRPVSTDFGTAAYENL